MESFTTRPDESVFVFRTLPDFEFWGTRILTAAQIDTLVGELELYCIEAGITMFEACNTVGYVSWYGNLAHVLAMSLKLAAECGTSRALMKPYVDLLHKVVKKRWCSMDLEDYYGDTPLDVLRGTVYADVLAE